MGHVSVFLVEPTLTASSETGQFRFDVDGNYAGPVFLTPELARQWIETLTPWAESGVESSDGAP